MDLLVGWVWSPGHLFMLARTIDGADTIQCNGDVDELVYERVALAGGGWRESWVSGGVLEFRRVVFLRKAQPIELRRDLGDR
jgi:hypothetical protein